MGWGSHHWLVTAAGGERWFRTVDELERRRLTATEPLDQAYGRLDQALGAARALDLPELYRLRWIVADLALDVDRFRHPHSGGADDRESWELLARLVREGLT